jgi:protoporphyrinogen oxidase
VVAQYGDFLTDTFYQRYTAKYWRVPMEDLAVDWLGGRLLPSQLTQIVNGAFLPQAESQAVFTTFRYPRRGGFFGFFAPLYERIAVKYQRRVVEVDWRRKTVTFATGEVEGYDHLASSLPLPLLIELLKDAPPTIREAARRLRHTQLICVNMIVDAEHLTDCHWFYIYDEDIDASRVSLPGNLSPGSVPEGRTALQAEIFRRDDEPFDAGQIVETAAQQMGKLLGYPARDLTHIGHVHVPRAYVISNHDRAGAVEHLMGWLEARDIFTMGLFGRWKYVWSDEAFRQDTRPTPDPVKRYEAPRGGVGRPFLQKGNGTWTTEQSRS